MPNAEDRLNTYVPMYFLLPLIANFARATDSVTGVFLGVVANYTNAGQNVSGVNDPIDRGLVAFG
ncbi:hypothetical protein [Desulfolucanica intricata]|uniref:hypothetical protein n=1 Tax=Desulfolucanica intricata TaxID=1285191 RepID=UPI0013520DEF|nr:hypothetical protein [Desulfolucanica intricata]